MLMVEYLRGSVNLFNKYLCNNIHVQTRVLFRRAVNELLRVGVILLIMFYD